MPSLAIRQTEGIRKKREDLGVKEMRRKATQANTAATGREPVRRGVGKCRPGRP